MKLQGRENKLSVKFAFSRKINLKQKVIEVLNGQPPHAEMLRSSANKNCHSILAFYHERQKSKNETTFNSKRFCDKLCVVLSRHMTNIELHHLKSTDFVASADNNVTGYILLRQNCFLQPLVFLLFKLSTHQQSD